jgi:membrane protease YdiL (CAAX protease family)
MEEDRNLIRFILQAYLISWSITAPLVLSSNGILDIGLPQSLTILASFGPTISSVILWAQEKGIKNIPNYLLGCLKPITKPVWTLVALLGPGAVGALSVFLGTFIRGSPPDFRWAAGLSAFPVVFLFVFFLGGPLGEEYGWRGYALPQLLDKYGWIKGNLILGAVWGLWHLPLFWIIGTPQSEIPLIGFILQIMGTTFIYSWIMQGTEGSIFTAMVFHTAGNAFAGFIPFLPLVQTGGNIYSFSVFIALIWLMAVAVSVGKLK